MAHLLPLSFVSADTLSLVGLGVLTTLLSILLLAGGARAGDGREACPSNGFAHQSLLLQRSGGVVVIHQAAFRDDLVGALLVAQGVQALLGSLGFTDELRLAFE